MPVFFRQVCGLITKSDEPIPGLVIESVPGREDVTIEFSGPASFPPTSPEPWYSSLNVDEDGAPALRVFRTAEGGYFFRYIDGTEFLIEADGAYIRVRRIPGTSVAYAATYLVGAVLAFVLRLRGVISLHASAIALGDAAVALAGPPRCGKSTTAAAFARAGYGVLADDIVALMSCENGYAVHPSHAHLRLWPDAAELLFGAGHGLPPICEGWEKLAFPLHDRYHPAALPLQAVYTLCREGHDDFDIVRLTAADAAMAVVSNAYAPYLYDDAMRARELRAISRVVEQVKVWKVTSGQASPGAVAEGIRAHATATATSHV